MGVMSPWSWETLPKQRGQCDPRHGTGGEPEACRRGLEPQAGGRWKGEVMEPTHRMS